MKIVTSYFYQIRFFTPNMIPLSTAAYDPKWFHDYQDQSYQFKDKRGVWNGLRAEPFCAVNAIPFHECGCPLCDTQDPDTCSFLARYRAYLDTLSFDEMLIRFVNIAYAVRLHDKFSQSPICALIFYEAPQNKCSERTEVIRWFHKHHYPIEEWHRKKIF